MDVKRVGYEIRDVSQNLEATDNYLEKYMPVRIQELINQAFKHFAKTDEEREDILNYEIQRYKELHNIVVKDTGTSKLDKSALVSISVDKLEKNLLDLKKKNQIRKAVSKHSTSQLNDSKELDQNLFKFKP
jgi:hypothetical protein